MADRRSTLLAKKKGRSRITNGSAILPRGVDGRTLWVRRFRDLIALHTADLGGEDMMSEAERALVRRSATIIIQLERMEFKFATGNDPSSNELETYQRLSNTLRRLLQTVGLERRQRDVTPSLQEYLKGKRSRHVIEAEAAG